MGSVKANPTRQPVTSLKKSPAPAGKAPDLLQLKTEAPENYLAAKTAHHFGEVPLFPATPERIQPKLKINAPGDAYEQEADRMAEKAMQLHDQSQPVASLSNHSLPPTAIQRQEMEGYEGGENESTLMQKAENGGGFEATSDLAFQLQNNRGGGNPLPVKARSFMERAFHADFSGVRVHTDASAAEMSQGIQARAFAHREDIYFNQGEYNPENTEGKRLLAHELAHILQNKSINVHDQIKRKEGDETKTTSPVSIHSVDNTKKEADKAFKTINDLLETDFFSFNWTVTDKEADRALNILLSLRPKSLLLAVKNMKEKDKWKKLAENVSANRKRDFDMVSAKTHPLVGYLAPGDVIRIKINSEKLGINQLATISDNGIFIPEIKYSSKISELFPRNAIEVINKELIENTTLIEPIAFLAIIRRGGYYQANESMPSGSMYFFEPDRQYWEHLINNRRKGKHSEFLTYLVTARGFSIAEPFKTNSEKLYTTWVENNASTPHIFDKTPEALWEESVAKAYEAVNPVNLVNWVQLPESIYAVAKQDLLLYRSPEDQEPTQLSVKKGDLLELTWQSQVWYYAFSALGRKGFVKSSMITLPPNTSPRSSTEEFVGLVGDVLFIQAPNMHRAFVLAKKSGLVANVGMVFWYGNGRTKPYPVNYYIKLPEPTEKELEEMRKKGGLSALTVSGTLRLGSVINTVGSTHKLSEKEQRWIAAEKEVKPYVDKFLLRMSDTIQGRRAFQVPYEWHTKIFETFDEFAAAKGLTKSDDPDSDYRYYYSVFELTAQFQIKLDVSEYGLQRTDSKDIVGNLEWLVASREKLMEFQQTNLNFKLERIVKEEQEKRKVEIEQFFKPYKEAFTIEQTAFVEKINKDIGHITDTVRKDYERKKAQIVLGQRQDEWTKKAQEEFEKSDLAKQIREAVEKRYTEEVNKVISPDPYSHPVLVTDEILRAMVKYFDTELTSGKNYAERLAKLNSAQEKIGTYLGNKLPDDAPHLLKMIMVYYVNKMVTDEKGSISVFAIKQWALINYNDLDKAYSTYYAIFRISFEKDDPKSWHSDFSLATHTYTTLLEEILYAKEFFQKIIEHPENDEGFWDGFLSKEPHEFIPFIGTIIDIMKLTKLKMTTNREQLGARLSLTEELLLQAYAGLQQINKMKKKPFWYRVGEGVAEAIPFIGEFIITAPIGLGTGRIASKVVESALKRLAIRHVEGLVAKIIIKGAGVLVGSFFQTLANPLDIEKNILAHGMELVNLTMNEDGSFSVEVKAKDESKATALWKGFVSSYINVFTERLGGKLLPAAFGKVSSKFVRFLPMAARSSVFTRRMQVVSEALKKYTGFHGVLGEYEEEVYGQILESLVKGEQIKWDWEDQLVTFTTVAIMGAPVKGMQSVFVAYDIMRTFKIKGKNVVLPANIYVLLTQLTSESKFEDFKTLIENEKLKPEQKELALYLANNTLNLEHEVALSQEQMAAMQPQATIPKAIPELITLVIKLYGARKNLLISRQSNQHKAIESVVLMGEEGATLPLTLTSVEQADKWIIETEGAIANLEGSRISDIREAAGVSTGIEENITMWGKYATGWRPYIDRAKQISPDSEISINTEGRVSINGNVVISSRALIRMLVMDKTNLEQLLTLSLQAKKIPGTADGMPLPNMTQAELEDLKRLHPDSKVGKSESDLIDFNQEIQVSSPVLKSLLQDKNTGKFLFSHSYNIRTLSPAFAQVTPEDKIAILQMHPASTLTETGNNIFLVNDQILVSGSFLKEMLLKKPTDLKQLLSLTYTLNQAGGNIKKLSENDWKIFQQLTQSSIYRLRFRFNYETELHLFLARTGLDMDARFKPLWDKAGFEEKVRMWDLVNEGPSYTADRERRIDERLDLRKQANDFALSSNPNNLFEMIEYYQYYSAYFESQVEKEKEAYKAELGNEVQNAELKTGKDVSRSEEKRIEKELSNRKFGSSFEGTSRSLDAAVRTKLLKDMSDVAKGLGTVNATTITEVKKRFDLGVQEAQDKLGSNRIEVNLSEVDAVQAIKAVQNLAFASLTAVVYHVEKHYDELPESIRNDNNRTQAYIDAARRTVRDASQVSISYSPTEVGVRIYTFVLLSLVDSKNQKKYNLRAIVRELPDGTVFFATLIIEKR
mgnify:CR=1 FL=1